MLTLTHPAALWALLGIPVVLAIHFLQRRSRRVTVTTLFLLQQLQKESEQGNRIERLRLSIPLWLQLLMVLLFTWLLAGPRWLRQDAVHRIAIIMDDSASMQAFREAAIEGVQRVLSRSVPSGSKAELALLGSDVHEANLYYGGSAQELVKSLASRWHPTAGVHDFTLALRQARSLAGPEGAVLLVTDHPPATPLPYAAKTLSVGRRIENVGWAGVTVEEKDGQWFWRALVRNYGESPQQRQWHVETQGQTTPPMSLALAPRETRTLSGPFPGSDATQALTLQLTPDAFGVDDQLPLVQPSPKKLSVHLPRSRDESSTQLADLFGRFAHLNVSPLVTETDVRVMTWPPSTALENHQHACVFASPSRADKPAPVRGAVVSESHPLVEGLNWNSLLIPEGMVMPRDPQDQVLLWQGERPLISLRITPVGARQLFCHFDLIGSNARKLPALAILLHRFLETIRQDKLAAESANYELRQSLSVAHRQGEAAQPLVLKGSNGLHETIPQTQARLLRSPAVPGFFQISQGPDTWLTAAAHFADSREADLSKAAPFDETPQLEAEQVDALQEADPHWQWWTLLLLLCLLGSWWWGKRVLTSNAPFGEQSSPAP
ncbi:Aerotolerance regulator N-terminal [Prosthecobacter debontii]|uniref:Aerotolerance regulator N-terminal n=1 Tax=Prosthecobacter debontii TaxID=48467 RepID=A0A1T4WS19_9BACT|nr:BatA domain-containing protein [Prosthecobacter debontii]SKA79907.1 Aerotolerance regulator N-terminal [Prosthecobacter debontii]